MTDSSLVTTITTTAGSTSATVPTIGLSSGWNITAPPLPAVGLGNYIAHIAGTTITLALPALVTASGFAFIGTGFVNLGSGWR